MGITAILLFLAFANPPDPHLERVKNELAGRFGFPRHVVDSLFSDPRLARYNRNDLLRRRFNWRRYTAEILLSPSSVEAGWEYLREHREAFRFAEEYFGVESAYLVSILRIETDLGRNLGDYRVMNVFYTRLQEPARRAFAHRNLVALSTYCLIHRVDCYEIRGSHAGAIGLPQFLPATIIEYGVDANGDGVENLFEVADAVASAANYLSALGWRRNRMRALALYYGSSRGYPEAVRRYAAALGNID
ncbi:MAG TPA: lytic murein transglycosylase [Candidatus Paceibacterota bacterium]|nr:lytic murein transglycosylase [Candidatus Paceibacterota bacterium]